MRKTILYTKGYLNILALFGLAFITVIAIEMIQDKDWVFVFFISFLGFVQLRYWLFTPQSVILEGNTIKEKYLFSERTFKAQDIETINVNRRVVDFGRGGRAHSFVDIQAKNGDIISIEYFAYKTPDIHEILQGWHKKHSTSTRESQQN